MIKQLFLCLSGFLFLVSCKNNETHPSVSADTEITKKVNQLYTEYDGSKKSIYNQSFSNSLFSPELKKTLEDAIHASEADIERVKKSDHPDEKPLLFEGAVFSSLYEGYTGYKIKSVKVDPSRTSANVAIELEYTLSPPKIKWTDHVQLINSGQGWRIDNILFDSIGNTKDLKASLKEFTQNANK
ncbi:DUF3828 domain-containing protein [Chryseobacterium herbae]|uniref:DUF3828 domain-containing protein n=1 Tax=Chryseobacterium herbae TaxID=2976476 RepID=A0ABT2IZK3_9FLAO|nr:DUF3828 domain-containing protein [Chryseobacterium sp. pc1-10]MCT2564294.1 DUF3828 domain-containing protein [Chryseobacterium sp. pc1-10]